MLRVTADSNIYISGLLFTGAPFQFLEAARAGRFELSLSDAILTEIQRVLRVKFLWQESQINDLPARLGKFTQQVQPAITLKVVQADPDDDRVLECAVAAGSHYLVTGDNDLLRIGQYSGIQIVRVADFMKLVPIP